MKATRRCKGSLSPLLVVNTAGLVDQIVNALVNESVHRTLAGSGQRLQRLRLFFGQLYLDPNHDIPLAVTLCPLVI
jgi:hypothetical protein